MAPYGSSPSMSNSSFSPGQIVKGVIAVACLIVLIVCVSQLVVSSDTNEIMVVQNPVTGNLSFYRDGGIHWQGFGKVTRYHKQQTYSFLTPDRTGEEDKDRAALDNAIQVRFNDGGHGNISGTLTWVMPLDDAHLKELHTGFGSQSAIEQQLIRTVVNKSVYMTGPLMSSAESYAAKRNELIKYIEDQASGGVYQTYAEDVKQADPITNEMKTVTVVRLRTNAKGETLRQEESPLQKFGVQTYGLSINKLKYDDRVEAQIQQQQQAIMQVQTAIANAKKAEQDAITAAKNGEAEAAKAKWDQEVIKATRVTSAQADLDVARLENDKAEQYKQSMIKKGQGEGEYKRLVMQADGALDPKIKAYIETQKFWADAFARHQGPLVPQIMAGGSGASTSALNWQELLGFKAARDLGLDLSIPKGTIAGK